MRIFSIVIYPSPNSLGIILTSICSRSIFEKNKLVTVKTQTEKYVTSNLIVNCIQIQSQSYLYTAIKLKCWYRCLIYFIKFPYFWQITYCYALQCSNKVNYTVNQTASILCRVEIFNQMYLFIQYFTYNILINILY